MGAEIEKAPSPTKQVKFCSDSLTWRFLWPMRVGSHGAGGETRVQIVQQMWHLSPLEVQWRRHRITVFESGRGGSKYQGTNSSQDA